jgi:intein/homing endonuclease
MRVLLKKGKQKELLLTYKQNNKVSWQEFSTILNVTKASLLTWYHEQTLLPYEVYKQIDPACFFKQYVDKLLPEGWGRMKGGVNSSGTTKAITKPSHCKELAELIGIILGDGNLHEYKKSKKIRSYMLRIAGDYRKENAYISLYVFNLCKALFKIEPKISVQASRNEIFVILHSKEVVNFLKEAGLKPGDKLKSQVGIPQWVFEDKIFLKSCIRGLVDTDGSIYRMSAQDPQLLRISFTNFSDALLESFKNALVLLGYHPTSAHHKVYLSRKADITKYLKEVGCSNDKNIARLRSFKFSPVV